MLRRFLLTLVVMSLTFVAAGKSTPAQAQAATCTGTPVTLRLDDWSSGDRVEYMNQVLASFTKENPCITVKAEPNIGDDQNTRRLTMIASNTAPDLLATGESWIPLYAEAGGFLDLTPYVKGKDGFDPAAQFYEAVFKQGYYKGIPYAIAKDYSTSAFYINQGLFDKAGIAYPKDGWTWKDAIDMAEQLTVDKSGNNAASPDFDAKNVVQYGMDIIPDGWWRGYQSYLYSFGAHTISDDGTKTTGFLDSDKAVAAWSAYRDLVFKAHIAPSATLIGSVQGGRVQMFQDGKVAIGITFHGPWWQDVLNKVPNLKWGVVPLPAGPDGKRESAVMWMGWGINAKTKYPAEAFKLLKYLTTEPGQRVFALKALSADKAVASAMQRTTDPYWSVFLGESNRLGKLDEQANPYYGPCVFTPAGDLLTRALSDGGDKLDLKTELSSLAKKADACLADAAKSGVATPVK